MESGVCGYELVFVDDLSEGEWERWTRGVKGDTRSIWVLKGDDPLDYPLLGLQKASEAPLTLARKGL